MNSSQAIKHALSDLVNKNKMFTNYDVTKHARSFTDDNVRHQDVIAYVSVEMHSGNDNDISDYYVDVTNVYNDNGDSDRAIVYCPKNMNVYSYDQNAIKTNKSLISSTCCGGNSCVTSVMDKAKQAASAAAGFVKRFQTANAGKLGVPVANPASTIHVANPIASVSSVVTEVIIDNRGRVCIPKSFLTRIGVKSGDLVYAHRSNIKGSLVLAAIRWSDNSHKYLGAYQVDCYGNARITHRSLRECNYGKCQINGFDHVVVRSENDHIVID